MSGISRARLAWGILGAGVLVASTAGVTLAASARPAVVSSPPAATYPGSGRAVVPVSAGVAGAAGTAPTVSYPGWCCSGGTPVGLTASGQATVRGSSAADRASAIARAVADAESQANAAARGARISLGRIINIEVSAPYYPYPLPLGAAGAASPSAAPGAGGPISACPTGSRCPYPGVSTYASVSVTWAIG